MKKIKTMKNCVGTGKVCCKVRSNYNQLADILSKIELLESEEQNDERVSALLLQVYTKVRDDLIQKIRKACLKCEAAEKIKVAKAEVEVAEQAIREAELNIQVAQRALKVAEQSYKNKLIEEQAIVAIKEGNEYLHRVYGDWVSMERTPDGFAVKVTLKGVDVVATLEKMDNDPNIPTNDNTFVDMLTKLRDSLANGTFVPKVTAASEEE